MKQSLWIIALLFGAALAQPLSASSYSITLLDGSGPTVDGTGSFTFSGGEFSAFTVTWDSFLFDFTSTANSYGSNPHGCDGGGSISVFTYLTAPNCQTGGIEPISWEGNAGGGSAQFTFAPDFDGISSPTLPANPELDTSQDGIFEASQTVPELNSGFLMATALVAIAFLARKRNARGRSSGTTLTIR
jgi:hypothetical protein